MMITMALMKMTIVQAMLVIPLWTATAALTLMAMGIRMPAATGMSQMVPMHFRSGMMLGVT